mmetsp:Transcript_59076/g.171334  ORF Transcript_59076/g.171334 Transcript_59076/m.171334 type:complete len:362 (+) Transcript_59076:352-1437(+)
MRLWSMRCGRLLFNLSSRCGDVLRFELFEDCRQVREDLFGGALAGGAAIFRIVMGHVQCVAGAVVHAVFRAAVRVLGMGIWRALLRWILLCFGVCHFVLVRGVCPLDLNQAAGIANITAGTSRPRRLRPFKPRGAEKIAVARFAHVTIYCMGRRLGSYNFASTAGASDKRVALPLNAAEPWIILLWHFYMGDARDFVVARLPKRTIFTETSRHGACVRGCMRILPERHAPVLARCMSIGHDFGRRWGFLSRCIAIAHDFGRRWHVSSRCIAIGHVFGLCLGTAAAARHIGLGHWLRGLSTPRLQVEIMPERSHRLRGESLQPCLSEPLVDLPTQRLGQCCDVCDAYLFELGLRIGHVLRAP